MEDDGDFKKEMKLIRKLVKNPNDEGLQDDLVKLYDTAYTCRGSFKQCLYLLIIEAKKEVFNDLDKKYPYHKISKEYMELKKKHLGKE